MLLTLIASAALWTAPAAASDLRASVAAEQCACMVAVEGPVPAPEIEDAPPIIRWLIHRREHKPAGLPVWVTPTAEGRALGAAPVSPWAVPSSRFPLPQPSRAPPRAS